MNDGKSIVGQVVVIGAVLIAIAGGLLWAAVNGMLPTGAGIGADLPADTRTIGMIVILAVIAVIAYVALPKKSGG
jgi:hypothetical protein